MNSSAVPATRAHNRHGSGGRSKTVLPKAWFNIACPISSRWPSFQRWMFQPLRAAHITLLVTVMACVESPTFRMRRATPACTTSPENSDHVTHDSWSTVGVEPSSHQAVRRFPPRFSAGAEIETVGPVSPPPPPSVVGSSSNRNRSDPSGVRSADRTVVAAGARRRAGAATPSAVPAPTGERPTHTVAAATSGEAGGLPPAIDDAPMNMAITGEDHRHHEDMARTVPSATPGPLSTI